MNNRPKVFVIKEQVRRTEIGNEPMDYSPAMMYGDIEFITKTDMPSYPNSSVQMNWDIDVARFVEAYDPSCDLIITTGQPTAIFAVGHALGLVKKSPRFLVWRRDENQYRVLNHVSSVIA
jgi:hypothetical protein